MVHPDMKREKTGHWESYCDRGKDKLRGNDCHVQCPTASMECCDITFFLIITCPIPQENLQNLVLLKGLRG